MHENTGFRKVTPRKKGILWRARRVGGLEQPSNSSDGVHPTCKSCSYELCLSRERNFTLSCLGFIHTLEIVTRILNEVVNRERLCGTCTVLGDASARWVAVRPLEEVLTQSNFVCLLDSKMVKWCGGGEELCLFVCWFVGTAHPMLVCLYAWASSTLWRSLPAF